MARHFPCHIRNVDELFIRYVQEYGCPKWMEQKASPRSLERYDADVLSDDRNILAVEGHNTLPLKMLRFIVEECVGAWALRSVLEGNKRIYAFHFEDETDFIMTRLAV